MPWWAWLLVGSAGTVIGVTAWAIWTNRDYLVGPS